MSSPQWRRWQEIPAVCLHPPHLRASVAVAIVVGTLLFAINQLDLVLSGAAGPRVWLKAALTYLVPFMVSNYGIVLATRQRTVTSRSPQHRAAPGLLEAQGHPVGSDVGSDQDHQEAGCPV